MELVLIVFAGTVLGSMGFADNAYATDYVISDSASCLGLPGGGEVWNGITSTCTRTTNLRIMASDSLIVSNGITLAFPLDDDLINRGDITNNGIINITEGIINNRLTGTFTNSGTIILNGSSNGNGRLLNQQTASFTNSGTIIIDGDSGTSGRLVNLSGASFTNSGTITLDGNSGSSGQLRNSNPATFINSGTITSTGGGGTSGLIRNFSTLTNSGLITTNYNFENNNANSVLINSGSITVTLNFNNLNGFVNNCGTITFGTFSGNPFVITSCTSPKSGSSNAYEDPTIGKSHDGRQMVEDGICIDDTCWTVTAAFHQDFELVEMLSDSTHTITSTVFCQNGVNLCNYVAYGVSPYGTNINDSVWKVILQKDHLDNWSMDVIDPEAYLGEVTSTTQLVNDNRHLSASATIEFKKPTPGMILNVEVRDSKGGYRDFKFNDGIAIVDSYAYPSVDSSYETPLEIESLCLYENPDKRYTCAFEKIREQSLIDAQIAYDELIAQQNYHNLS